jgi:hypothetical protein
MTTKLHIDIAQGVIDIEGDPDFVREIYTDFKEQLLNSTQFAEPASPPASDNSPSGYSDGKTDIVSKPKTKRRAASKRRTSSDEPVSGVVADSPRLDKSLDTSALGVFYNEFTPKNNAEKILIFLKFMTEKLGIENPNTDQVYTCFKATGTKIPKAFAQAFYDTSSKFGYIDFRSPTDLPVTISGDNYFNHTLKRKAAE